MTDKIISSGMRDKDVRPIDAIPVDERNAHQRFADSLREFANFWESNTDLQLPSRATFNIWPATRSVGKIARMFGKSKKVTMGDSLFYLRRDFGEYIRLEANWSRDQVCERVVVGQETVTEPVMAQVSTQTVTRDKVEWRCPKVLEPQELEDANE
jgi:hypothetical protein